jgi:hypothetical protein
MNLSEPDMMYFGNIWLELDVSKPKITVPFPQRNEPDKPKMTGTTSHFFVKK